MPRFITWNMQGFTENGAPAGASSPDSQTLAMMQLLKVMTDGNIDVIAFQEWSSSKRVHEVIQSMIATSGVNFKFLPENPPIPGGGYDYESSKTLTSGFLVRGDYIISDIEYLKPEQFEVNTGHSRLILRTPMKVTLTPRNGAQFDVVTQHAPVGPYAGTSITALSNIMNDAGTPNTVIMGDLNVQSAKLNNFGGGGNDWSPGRMISSNLDHIISNFGEITALDHTRILGLDTLTGGDHHALAGEVRGY